MNKLRTTTILLLTVFSLVNNIQAKNMTTNGVGQQRTPAFPGAEGFGMYTTGGRGGKVLHVTSLEDSNDKGTFRWACEQKGVRTIVFDVSGTIFLKSHLHLSNGDVTIAGQTAPGDGICIADYPFVVASDNVIIRYMRFRLGNRNVAFHQGDGLECHDHDDVIIDHCSVCWSIDECISVYGGHRNTVQWCIAAQSLVNAGHHKGAHGYGGIWGGCDASFHHNLMAHNTSRTPRLGPSVRTQDEERMDIRNNVIYNWSYEGCYGGEAMKANIVNNYYKPGPATMKGSLLLQQRIFEPGIRTSVYTHHTQTERNAWDKMWHIWGKFYIAGNVNAKHAEVTEENWDNGVYNQIVNDNVDQTFTAVTHDSIRLTDPIPFGYVTTQSADQAYEDVLQKVGCSLRRDKLDNIIIDDVLQGKATFTGTGLDGGLINTQDDAGGWPELHSQKPLVDTDGDGMPDNWEDSHGLNKNDITDGMITTDDGYTNLEHYMNGIISDTNQNVQESMSRQYSPGAWKTIVYHSPAAFFKTDEARRIGDIVLLYQRKWGGWPKNQSMNKPITTAEDSARINPELDDCTIDNDATVTPMTYLAKLYQATGIQKYKDSFMRGVEYLLKAQYRDSGGWPQFWPNAEIYRPHITYNDDAMMNVMTIIRDIRDDKAPFQGLADKKLKARLAKSFDKGIACILNTQIVVDGKLTVWCQQHDHITLQPAKARAYELPSFCSSESAGIVRLLMSLPNPDKRVKASVNAAVKWLADHQLKGIRIERFIDSDGNRDARLVHDENAEPTWARYYDLKTGKPFFSDRDSKVRWSFEEVGRERRAGYAWFTGAPGSIIKEYEKWKKKYLLWPYEW